MTNSQNKVTSAKSWKKKAQGIELNLPSGNIVKARRPGLQKIMSSGLLPDSLLPIVQKAMNDAKGLPPSDMKKMMESDPDIIFQTLDTMDRIAAMCVVDPVMHYHRRKVVNVTPEQWEDIPDDVRDEEIVYTDEVDMDDKNFLMTWAMGGSSDLELFRKQSEEYLGSIHAIASDENSAE